jgi:hypothetical protein
MEAKFTPWADMCIVKGHEWLAIGGRGCPKKAVECSQTVYQCARCAAWDYGYAGGPAHDDCGECRVQAGDAQGGA